VSRDADRNTNQARDTLPISRSFDIGHRASARRIEFEINRNFVPRLYRLIVPIAQEGDPPALGGRGDPTEWPLEMTRAPALSRWPRKSSA
jgi:aminoglycoside phosphotransferase family enzyme